MDKSTENIAHIKVLRWFFAYPDREFTLNELCKAVGIAKTTGNAVAKKLAKEDFLKIETLGKLWRIKADRSHSYFITEKIPYNLGLVYGSGIVERIREKFPNSLAIVLFGSYRKGDDIQGSDLDLAVEVIGEEPIKVIEFHTFSQLGYRKNVKVNIHVFSRKRVDLNVFASISNGIVLSGFLEVKPC